MYIFWWWTPKISPNIPFAFPIFLKDNEDLCPTSSEKLDKSLNGVYPYYYLWLLWWSKAIADVKSGHILCLYCIFLSKYRYNDPVPKYKEEIPILW